MIFYHTAPGAIYPVLTDVTLNNLGPDDRLRPDLASKAKLTFADAQVRPELRGFVHCYVDGTTSRTNSPRVFPLRGPYVFRVNGQEIFETIPGRMSVGSLSYLYFERDSHVHKGVLFGLATIFGGL